jgi:hypothetical protein
MVGQKNPWMDYANYKRGINVFTQPDITALADCGGNPAF